MATAQKRPRAKAAAKPGPAKARSAPAAGRPAVAAQIPLLEWIAAAVGLGLTLFVLGVIGWETVNDDHRPPEIALQVKAVTPSSAGYLVEVRVDNRGGRPAAQVLVEGELRVPGMAAETAEATFDYIPDHSTRQGGLIFSQDPRRGHLSLRAKGFVGP